MYNTTNDQPQKSPQPSHPLYRLHHRQQQVSRWTLLAVAVFLMGIGSGYLFWDRVSSPFLQGLSQPQLITPPEISKNVTDLILQINPSEGFQLPIKYGKIGPQLLNAGAIDLDRFVQTYEQAGQPLTDKQIAILRHGLDVPIIMDKENSYFLLNLFWAFGLVNKNPILTEGAMMQDGAGQVGRFASTGGWTLGAKPSTEIYANANLIWLSEEQQAILHRVAQSVYRPCCNNPTHFPDCNHGMAMLGILQLMASEDISESEMLEAAKNINAYWFPQQSLELALLFNANAGLDFANVDAGKAVSREYFSASGSQAVHQLLSENGLLPQAPNSGGSCGV